MTAPGEDNFLSPKFDPEIKKWIPKITSYMMPTRETCKMSCAIFKNPEWSSRGRRVVSKAMSKGAKVKAVSIFCGNNPMKLIGKTLSCI